MCTAASVSAETGDLFITYQQAMRQEETEKLSLSTQETKLDQLLEKNLKALKRYFSKERTLREKKAYDSFPFFTFSTQKHFRKMPRCIIRTL